MINVLRWSSWSSWAEQRESCPKNTGSFEPQVAEQVRPGDRPIPKLPNSFFGITGLNVLPMVSFTPVSFSDCFAHFHSWLSVQCLGHIRIPMIRSIALIGMLISMSLSASAETWHICTMVERMSRDDSVTVMKSYLGYSCTSSTAQGGGGSFKDRKQ